MVKIASGLRLHQQKKIPPTLFFLSRQPSANPRAALTLPFLPRRLAGWWTRLFEGRPCRDGRSSLWRPETRGQWHLRCWWRPTNREANSEIPDINHHQVTINLSENPNHLFVQRQNNQQNHLKITGL